MAPCIPPDKDSAQRLARKGVDMIIMGNDIMFLNQGFRAVRAALDD